MLTIPRLLEILKPLSEETRYSIVKLLLSHDHCVGALARRLNISESAVSQHLKILRTAGIIKGDKRGYFMHYYVDRDLLRYAAENIAQLAERDQKSLKCSKSHKNMSYTKKGGNNRMHKPTCKYPELKPEKGTCSKEQIKVCHGSEKDRPCSNERKEDE